MMQQHSYLRNTIESDIEILFENQADDEAIYMAAFTSKDPKDRAAYVTKWKRLLKEDPTVHMQTIIVDDKVVGTVTKFEMNGESEITYALNKAYWGRGITTKAVTDFLLLEKKRPINGVAAKDNVGSIRILEKCGFKFIRHEKNFANARGKEIEEAVYRLED